MKTDDFDRSVFSKERIVSRFEISLLTVKFDHGIRRVFIELMELDWIWRNISILDQNVKIKSVEICFENKKNCKIITNELKNPNIIKNVFS